MILWNIIFISGLLFFLVHCDHLLTWHSLEIKPDNISVMCKYQILKNSLVFVLSMSSLQPVSLPHDKQEMPLKFPQNSTMKKTGVHWAIKSLFSCLTFIKSGLPQFVSFPLGNHLLKPGKISALEESQREVRWHLILFSTYPTTFCMATLIKTLRLPS